MFTVAFFLLAVGYTYFNGKDLLSGRLMDQDLLDAGARVARVKKWDHEWLKIGIPLVSVWILWLTYELLQLGNKEMAIGFGIGAAIGLTTGAIIGLRTHAQIQEAYQSLLDQSEDLKREG